MNKDLIYAFDKKTFTSVEVGEVQSNFNMSFVLDGTKDSTQLEVRGYEDIILETNTIIWHQKTDTWWIINHYLRERHLNEDGTFYYIHRLQLQGAVELLNARDLTDHGYNQGTYTVQQFVQRLFSMSNFEFSISFTNYVGTNFLQKKVDFVKSFENYTLVSALREFFDEFNMSAKLSFNKTTYAGNYVISGAVLTIMPKTGRSDINVIDISEFDDVKETVTLSKDSYGTCVVSNAENVISSISKTYPSTGSIKASSTEYNITPTNAVIRLPSNVFKANWLKMISTKLEITVSLADSGWNAATNLEVNVTSLSSIDKMFDNAIKYARSQLGNEIEEALRNYINANKDIVYNNVVKAGTVTLFNGSELNPVDGTIIQGVNVPYLVTANVISKLPNAVGTNYKQIIFCDEETKNTLPTKYQGIQWKRGSNIISGFELFDAVSGSNQSIKIENLKYTDLQTDSVLFVLADVTVGTKEARIEVHSSTYRIHFGPSNQGYGDVQFIVNYIPMSDIKLKVDNTNDRRDVQLYNQNGKLTDNIALSKLINSYSKEISSVTKTRFMQYYDYTKVPRVGSLVNDNGTLYVINNVSMDFSQNENTNNDFGYFIEAEFTMSKSVACKSLMVNPNTNIRDYGIPQNFNVKRKQLYRDFYELGYTIDANADSNYYLDPSNVFNFGTTPNKELNFIAVIQCDYGVKVNNSYNWYYQLETTVYEMNKMFYVICDFNDNNIIGYASQNVFSGFVISRVFSGLTDNLNTPISYVDKNGQVKGIDILFMDNEQLTSVYDEYQSEQVGGDSYKGSLYNYSCFIPQDIYLKGRADGKHKIRITESTFVNPQSKDYNKDAIEVPVFEYGCQIDDSDDVLIGDGILYQRQGDYIFFYSHVAGQNLTPESAMQSVSVQVGTYSPLGIQGYYIYASSKISYDRGTNKLTARIYNGTVYSDVGYEWHDGASRQYSSGYDYAFFRHAYNINTGEEIVDLLFIAKNVPTSALSSSNQVLTLYPNHYKPE